MIGSKVQAVAEVKTAIQQLQKSLAGLQMGSELHNAVAKAVAEIGKHVSKEEGDAASVVQQLAQLARAQGQTLPPAMMRPPAPPGAGAPPMPAAA